MIKTPYIFLDCDGVLYPYHHPDGLYESKSRTIRGLDSVCIQRLNTIIDATGAKIILASAWGSHSDSPDILKEAGLKAPIFDICGAGGSGENIVSYLENHPEIENFICIEDEWYVFDKTPQLIPRVVYVQNSYAGLQNSHVQEAISRLSGVPYRWKVLCVRQPWAWLLIHGGKDVENRSWKTSYRGPLLICASKGCTKTEYEEAVAWCLPKKIYVPPYKDLERGGIIGMVYLYDSADGQEYPHRWHLVNGVSPWYMGGVAWCVRNPTPLPFHEIKGRLGIFEVDYELSF